MKITKLVAERARAPESGQAFIRDDDFKGFALRITAGGAKAFVWEGRVRGRMRRVTIGPFPALSVLAARRKVLAIKAAVAEGKDPAETRHNEHNEPTFTVLADKYLERHAKPHKKSWREDERRINAHLVPRFGTRRLSDIPRDELVTMQQVIRRERGLYESNRTTVLLRTMFNIAHDLKLHAGDNPAARIKLFREEPRERFLSPDELRRVNDALAAEPDWRWRAYFPLSLMLGTRKTEMLAARWADVDLEQRTLRLPITKAGRSHLLPLPTPAAEMLRTLPSHGESEWLFPSRGATGHLVEVASAWQRIRGRAGVPDVRVHDLRRTLGSWLAAQGYSLPLIGRALNHSNSVSTAVYARLQLDPVREALERNAALMLAGTEQSARPEHVEDGRLLEQGR